MVETEVKFEVSALEMEELARKLEQMGANLLATFYEEVHYFDTPHGSIRTDKKTLRLKENNVDDYAKVQVKKKTGENTGRYKTREEFEEARFMTSQGAAEFLEVLGFVEKTSYGKLRRHWAVAPVLLNNELDQDVFVELDFLPELQRYFVEIEGSENDIDRVAKELGLRWSYHTTSTKSYRSIVDEHRKRVERNKDSGPYYI